MAGSGDRPGRWADSGGAPKTLATETLRIPCGVEDILESAQRGSLLVISGKSADLGVHILVEHSVIIGRETPGLQLRDVRCSRRHVAVERRDERYFVRDLGSTNGTRLNGRLIERESFLGDGDKIQIGETVIKFTVVDNTEAEYLKRMRRMAGTDALTGLHAKHVFDAMLSDAVRSARETGLPLTVMMMDLDGLKAINDAHGHHLGAHTISEVGRAIGRILQGRGEACRFGGDEYCAMLPGVSETGGLDYAERIRSAVQATHFTKIGVTVRATISIGVAAWLPEMADSEAVVAAADRALYRAKGKGRNICSA